MGSWHLHLGFIRKIHLGGSGNFLGLRRLFLQPCWEGHLCISWLLHSPCCAFVCTQDKFSFIHLGAQVTFLIVFVWRRRSAWPRTDFPNLPTLRPRPIQCSHGTLCIYGVLQCPNAVPPGSSLPGAFLAEEGIPWWQRCPFLDAWWEEVSMHAPPPLRALPVFSDLVRQGVGWDDGGMVLGTEIKSMQKNSGQEKWYFNGVLKISKWKTKAHKLGACFSG